MSLYPNHQGLACVAASATVGNSDSLQGALRHHGLGSKAKVAPATGGAVARGCYRGSGESGPWESFYIAPTPGPKSWRPRGKRPTGTVRVTALGCSGGLRGRADQGLQVTGTSPAGRAGDPADCSGQRGVPGRAWPSGGSAEAGTPGRAGAELIKARRREQGESRQVAVRPSSASASRREFRAGRAETPAGAGSGRREPEGAAGPAGDRRSRPPGGRSSRAPHVRRPALSAMARSSSGPRTSL